MHELARDIRQTFRQFARKPAVLLLAITSLALGIGVNTAMFSLVSSILWSGPDATDPEQLVHVYFSDSGGFEYATWSYPDFVDVEQRNDVLTELSAAITSIGAWQGAGSDGTELLFGEEVSANYFRLLGSAPALGRDFLPEEAAEPGGDPVVVLGHDFWTQRMAADPAVLGKSFKLSGVDFTVVGVAPKEVRGMLPALSAAYFIPITMHDRLAERSSLDQRGSRSLLLRGRLKTDVTVAQAGAQFDTLAAQLAAEYPETNEGRKITLVSSSEVALNPGVDAPVIGVAGLLMAVVGLVLLIACSNIANLLLARAADRRKEIAIRLSLGSGRGRLIRQLLTESSILALIGGGLGILVAHWTTRLIVGFQPPLPIPLALSLELDGRVLAFTTALAIATGLVCGLAPAIQATRPDLVPALKDDSDILTTFRRWGLRNILVVAQVTVSTVLLIGAGLFLRSLSHAQVIDPGFSLDQGVAVQVALGLGNRYDEAEGRVFLRRLQEDVDALPGARSSAYTGYLPLSLQMTTRGMLPEGVDVADGQWPEAMTTEVGPGYFSTMGIDLRRGRGFSPSDGPEAPPVIVINEAFAQTWWPDQDPIGKRVKLAQDEPWREVVGVAADGKYFTLGEDTRPFLYRNIQQDYQASATLIVASDLDEATLMAQVKGVIDTLDPAVPIFDDKLLSEHLSLILFPARLGAALLTAFGVLGLLLATLGLYGVVAYSVARRTRELGIRVAIGADWADVLTLVTRESLALVATGATLGLGIAALSVRALTGLLYGIEAFDPLTFVGVPVLLLGIAVVATLGPVRRALSVDPSSALRYD